MFVAAAVEFFRVQNLARIMEHHRDPDEVRIVRDADSDEGGQLFRLKPDSNSDRLRTPFR